MCGMARQSRNKFYLLNQQTYVLLNQQTFANIKVVLPICHSLFT